MQTSFGELRGIDAHVHFFSHQFFQSFLKSRRRQFPEQDPQSLLQRLEWEVPPPDPVDLGRRWVDELDRHGVEQAVLLGSIMNDEESVARAVQAFPDRFIGFLRLDPTRPDAAQRVRHAVERLGLRGIKGFPAMECFHANDEAVYPVYEEAQRLGVPILFHFGEKDENPSQADMRKLDEELTRLGKPHRFYTYPGADHAFMDYTAARYQRAASEISWPRTLEFFAQHLKRTRVA